PTSVAPFWSPRQPSEMRARRVRKLAKKSRRDALGRMANGTSWDRFDMDQPPSALRGRMRAALAEMLALRLRGDIPAPCCLDPCRLFALDRPPPMLPLGLSSPARK